ncbi:unnamed protein product, partial [Effrenium voratum]
YGNSKKEVTNLCVLLPIHVGGRKIKVLTYVNKGTAPILFGRPIMEKLGLQLDYSAKKMKWPNHGHDVPLGPKGEYLVNLVEDNSMHRLIHEEIAFETLIPEDFMDHVDFSEKLPPSVILGEMEECFEEGCLDAKKGSSEAGCSLACEEEKKDDLHKQLSDRKDLRKLNGTTKAIKDQEILLAEANRIPVKGRERRVVWEVFAVQALVNAAREENHDTILMMCAVTYECQRYWTYVDQCQYGLMSEVVESYPLAQLLAAAPTDAELINAVEDDEAKKEEQGNVVSKEVEDQMPEADEIKQNKELRIKVLAKMLEEVQATGDVMKAAQGYLCPKCYARKAPSGTAPAAGLTAKEFNTRRVVTVMDQATRYVAIRLLKTEQSVDFIKGMERSWVKHWGCPRFVRADEAKGWASLAPLLSPTIGWGQSSGSIKLCAGHWSSSWMRRAAAMRRTS